jgi:putative transposase
MGAPRQVTAHRRGLPGWLRKVDRSACAALSAHFGRSQPPPCCATRAPARPQARRPADAFRLAGRPGRQALEEDHDPGSGRTIRADRIRHDFTADASRLNARLCGDITHIRTWEGWLFLLVIDIASRRVVGYAMADHLGTELISAALGNAAAARDPAPGVIFHFDRGCPVHPADFAGLAEDYQVVLSLGRKGQCWDNALAENFFAWLKGELTDNRRGPTRAGAGPPTSSTSAGTTAPCCTAPSATSAPPNSKLQPKTKN